MTNCVRVFLTRQPTPKTSPWMYTTTTGVDSVCIAADYWERDNGVLRVFKGGVQVHDRELVAEFAPGEWRAVAKDKAPANT